MEAIALLLFLGIGFVLWRSWRRDKADEPTREEKKSMAEEIRREKAIAKVQDTLREIRGDALDPRQAAKTVRTMMRRDGKS